MEPIYGIPPDLIRGPQIEALSQAENINWGMEKYHVQLLRDAAAETKIKLGIVDTGVDPRHEILSGNYQGSRDFTGSPSGAMDRNGHGSHCSGTVCGADPRIGVASGFPFYHGKGLSDQGSGGNELMDAIEYCLSEGCLIVSNSWGGGGQNPPWETKFRAWAEHPSKPWLIFAAGNSGPNTPDTDWPGRSKHLFNVGALDSNFNPASFSSAGAKMNTAAPGVDIISARPGGGYQSMSGTSMATPFVTGVLGLYRAALTRLGLYIPTIYELQTLLVADSMDVHTPGVDRRTGPGAINTQMLLLNLTPDPKPLKP